MPLRHPRLWLAGGWLLVAGVIVGSLAPAPMIQKMTLDLSDKLMHVSAYFTLMFWFGGLYRRGRRPLVAALLLCLGVGLDLLQGLTATRSLDPYDMLANGLGVLAALVPTMWWREGWCQRVEQCLVRRSA